jgi:hypothetical protein
VKGGHAVLILAIAAGVLFWWGGQASGGTLAPGTDERTGAGDDFSLGFAGSQPHLAPCLTGNVTLPHRYPAGIGDNITVLINSGLEALKIPHQADMAWFVKPPSEAVL